ncbi:OLC1v1034175C3 [Oldenlandia corymbosa var. corymbosa]|uniref:Glycosyltransferase n=1 Tax=Oldenlandia corymbosa var. corymbosa TaxID=529605 RepID=A0AAV1CRB9_OLDCO|nr:OLC1v1034175C3 [Oldenlandia corymbosa var. corymbosa]
MADQYRKLHIVVFPWLAFGHMLPALNFSFLIARKGHKISFLSTSRNIDRLPKLPPDLEKFVTFVEFSLPRNQNLPENAEAASDIPDEKVKYLQLAYDGLKEPIEEFLQKTSPDWVFHDYVPYWLPSIASKLEINTAFLSTFNASTLGYLGPASNLNGTEDSGRKKVEDFTVKPEWVPFHTAIYPKYFEVVRNAIAITGSEESVADFYRCACCIESCDIIAVRSCFEFEPEWLKLLEELHQKPIIPIGLIPITDEFATSISNNTNASNWSFIKEWLDKQKKGSVVYISFGSEAKLNQADLTEIALGIEFSGFPFFWVLKMKRGDGDNDKIQLPHFFEDRTKDRGMVYTSWAPQLQILNHESVGGFFTHCGWSSIVEALQFGKPMILFPFAGDQPLNSRMLEEKKLGFPVPRDEFDGSFTMNSVSDSLKLIMTGEEGNIYRDRVREMNRVLFDHGVQDHYVENLLAFLQNYKKIQVGISDQRQNS